MQDEQLASLTDPELRQPDKQDREHHRERGQLEQRQLQLGLVVIADRRASHARGEPGWLDRDDRQLEQAQCGAHGQQRDRQ